VLLASPAGAAEADPYVRLQWGLRVTDAMRARPISTGAGAVVAVIDTGVDASHPDLDGRVLPGMDLVDDDADAADGNGHGTLVAGIIAAGATNGIGGAGVAPGAMILPVRVLDDEGIGRSSDVAAGIRFATEQGADVINLSLAQDSGSDPLSNLLADPSVDDAIVEAARGGATVVVAAGNSHDGGHPETSYDATVAGVLVVGATTKADARAAYSNHGSGLDVWAPGGGSATDARPQACSQSNGIVAAWWNPETASASYGAGCGTSMAVGFVSATAAMLRAGGATNAQAAARILRTSDDVPGVGPRLNVARALGVPDAIAVRRQGSDIERATVGVPRPAPPPSAVAVSSQRITRPASRADAPVAVIATPAAREPVGVKTAAAALLALVIAAHMTRRQRREASDMLLTSRAGG
jgi:subtilisin family serine protease